MAGILRVGVWQEIKLVSRPTRNLMVILPFDTSLRLFPRSYRSWSTLSGSSVSQFECCHQSLLPSPIRRVCDPPSLFVTSPLGLRFSCVAVFLCLLKEDSPLVI